MTQDYDYHLKRWWDNTKLTLFNKAQDTDLVKSLEFKAYTLAGKQAGSIIFRITEDGKTYETLQVGRILNNGDLIVTLGTLEQMFDQELPQMEYIIKSMKLTNDRY